MHITGYFNKNFRVVIFTINIRSFMKFLSRVSTVLKTNNAA